MKTWFSLALIFVLATPLAERGMARAQEADEKQSPIIGIESNDRSDAAIEQRIRSIFRQLSAFQQVQIEVAAGVVTLTGDVADAQAVAEAEQLASRVEGIATVRNEIALEASVEKRLLPAFTRLEERLIAAYDLAPLLAVALLVFAIIVVLGLWLASFQSLWNRIAPNAFVADLIRQIVRLAFAAAGLVIALDILGATALLGTILGAAGIFGLAVGFALKDTIENYVASIMLSIRQPFRPNDHVQVGAQEGHVIRLTSRATVLMSLDGNHIRIPNADVFKGVVTNFTRNPERRFEFTVGVAADCNLKYAVDTGLEALERLEFVLERPDPLGTVQEVGDSNVVLWFSGWIDQRKTDYAKARGEAIRLTKRALEEAGVAMPEPIYRLRMEGPPLPGSATDQAAPKAGPAQASGPVESPVVGDASKETAVTDKVTAERSSPEEEDLLDPAAPRE